MAKRKAVGGGRVGGSESVAKKMRKVISKKTGKPKKRRNAAQRERSRIAAKSNPWLIYVEQVHAANPGLTRKEAMKKAAASYK